MAVLKVYTNNKCWKGHRKKGTLVHCWWEMEIGTDITENSMKMPLKTKGMVWQFRRRRWHPAPVLLPGKPHGWGAWWAAVHGVARSRTQLSDSTFTFHFHGLGKGNGNPLQCSCPENPRDWGAWWAAIYGVAQSRTQLKRLSSSIWVYF